MRRACIPDKFLQDDHGSKMLKTEQCSGNSCQSDIAGAASECLQTERYKFLRQVVCECDRGTLTLRGTVSSYYQKQLAQEAVARVTGVIQVVNEIEVCGSF